MMRGTGRRPLTPVQIAAVNLCFAARRRAPHPCARPGWSELAAVTVTRSDGRADGLPALLDEIGRLESGSGPATVFTLC